jgi:hypothetical protein
MVLFWDLIAAGAEDMWNLAGGLWARDAAKKQMEYSQQMMREGQELSAAYERPGFEIPQAIQQQQRGLQGRQYQQMPGMQMAQNRMGQAFTQGLGSAERRGGGAEAYGAASQMYGQNLMAGNQLAGQQAQYTDQAQQQYLAGLGGLGQWQQQEWQWDKANPYLAAQQKAAQMEMMGRQGEFAGIGAMGGSMSAALTATGVSGTTGLAGMGQAGMFQGQGGNTGAGSVQVNPNTWQQTQMPVQGPTSPGISGAGAGIIN